MLALIMVQTLITVTEPQYLEITKDNLTHPYGQPPSAAELSLVDSAFFPASLLSS